MISISHKTKQFGLFIIKILIVFAAFYFIYNQLTHHTALKWTDVKMVFKEKVRFSDVFIVLILSILNRFFEVLKWQNLVCSFQKITLSNAAAQVLSALTLGVFTPYGIGEYIGKSAYYEKYLSKKVILLNVLCNGIQIPIYLLFGSIGLLFFKFYKLVFLFLFLILLFLMMFIFAKKYIEKIAFLKSINQTISSVSVSIHQKNTALAIGRFFTIVLQYYFIFNALEINISFAELLFSISIIYLLGNIMPSFQLLDFAVKGSLAVYFFGLIGVNQWFVVLSTTIVWVLNIVFPVIIGSYFVLKFNKKQ